MRVELDIFSGRENPSWNLSLNESQVFMEKLSSLPHGNQSTLNNTGLGYRGFIVRGDMPGDMFPKEVRIFHGAVSFMAGDRFSSLSDPGREIEMWLIESAKPHIDMALYQSLKQEILRENIQ